MSRPSQALYSSASLLDALLRWQWLLLVFWTLISAIGLFFDVRQETIEAEESARIEVRAHVDEHVLIRLWAALHSGVYVPVDAYTSPNPFLEGLVEERDLVTPSGRQLTLINPAYLTRQLLELGERKNHPSITHLTSLHPVNPLNAPDQWEHAALQRFEDGAQEVSSVSMIHGQPYMRLMHPLRTEKPCLQCHAQHGYQEGDIRGGLSVAVPMAPHLEVSGEHRKRMLLVHGGLWFLGCLGIFWGTRRFKQRVQQNLRLQGNLHKLSIALEQAGEAIIITDESGRIEYVNMAFVQMTDWPSAKIQGHSPRFLRAKKDDPVRFRHMWRQIHRGHIWQQEMPIRKRDGTLLTTKVSVAPVYYPQQPEKPGNYVGIIRDVSREQVLEGNLRQMQKMESLGLLVGGIAHDFNNILAGMLGHMYLAKVSLSGQDKAEEALSKAETLGFRASSMISQLLAFARRDAVTMKALDFAPFFKEAVKLARISIPENIMLNCQVNLLSPVSVFADATQIQQIIMNLLNNARDALANIHQPKIEVLLDIIQVDEDFSRIYHLSGEQYVRIRVSDNGSGIEAADLEKVFDPFFTTKEAGKGTGLGLAMVYGAVRTHGGVIEAKSTADQGTCFTIYLPVHKQEDLARVASHGDIEKGKQDCVLLVDDDDSLREALCALLRSLNYVVLEARDGQQAVELFQTYHAGIAVIMMDLVMPGLSGIEAAKIIRQQREDIPLLFMTGYDQKQLNHDTQTLENAVLMTKPFDILQLSQQLHRMVK